MPLASFRFLTVSDLRFGRGEAEKSTDALAQLGQRPLLVHGHDGSRADWLFDALSSAGCNPVRMSISFEPDVKTIENAVSEANAAAVQAVIAIGGGAVIDAGKAIAALVPASRPMIDHLEVVGKGLPLEIDPLPFAALPTTAGTGAEVTKNAVISVPDAKRKVSLRDDRMLPDLAIIDPALTDELPRSVTLASGLDAVTQVIEPYLSCKANLMTDALCRSAISGGMKALVQLMQQEKASARDDLAWTSLCGGLALANSGLGAVHGLAGVLGGVTNAAHGALCGTLLPHVLEANERELGFEKDNSERLQRFDEVKYWIASALDCPQDLAFAELQSWSRYNGLPNLHELGLQQSDISEVAASSQSSSSMKGNPVPLSVEQLEAILTAAY